MIDCLIIGDSIAVGTHAYIRGCAIRAQGGINSRQFNTVFPGTMTSKKVAISLGANDHIYVRTREELEHLRSRIIADQVIWILPSNAIAQTVRDIATKHGDTILSVKGLSPDGIHPTAGGYRRIAEEITQQGN